MIHPFKVPMKVRFRGVTERSGVLIEGPAGWGEFSPFPDYGPEVTPRWRAAAFEAATRPWPKPVRTSISVNVTVPAISAEEAHALVTSSGCTTAKVKVAEGADIERVRAVRDALGPEGRIRVDVNGKWDVPTAVKMIRQLEHLDLEYVEQPVASLEEMAALRKLVDTPLAVDESIRTAEDPLKVKAAEAADIAVLKVQPLGGVYAALQVAEACGLPVVVSSALETSVGLAAGLAFAAALPELPFACGLATASLLAKDVVTEPLTPIDGAIELRRPAPDASLLQEVAPDEDEARSLLMRFEEAGGAP
jgi:O-succinylbenzoate synthase